MTTSDRLWQRAVLAAAVLFLASCQAGGILGLEAELGEAFGIRVGESVSLDDGTITVALNDIPEDSRCPVDAVCIWQGNARLSMTAAAGGELRAFALNTAGPPTGPRTVYVYGYAIELLRLDPQPRAGRSIPLARYQAALRVSRIASTGAAEAAP